ncbi:hypothetical protein ACHZ98_12905 [Streptomyces sp. MAR4 CNY-716]
MTVRIRAALSRAVARRLADVSFCDGCGQVCDTACRADAHRRRLHLPLSPHAPIR